MTKTLRHPGLPAGASFIPWFIRYAFGRVPWFAVPWFAERSAATTPGLIIAAALPKFAAGARYFTCSGLALCLL